VPGNFGFWFIAEFWIWDETSGVDFWLLIRLHNAGKTIVVKMHLTDEFEKKYEHIGFLGFLKSRTGPDRNRSVWLGFGSVSFFFQKKKPVWLFFIVKNRTEPKMITPTSNGFFYWNRYGKKKLYLYYSKCYFINLAFQNSILYWKCSKRYVGIVFMGKKNILIFCLTFPLK
jgi:hypothetical protein